LITIPAAAAQATGQRGHLGAAPIAVGEAALGRLAAEPIGTPAEHQAHHITEVVQGIADQGQRPEGKADQQLQRGEAGVEDDAPAEGTTSTALMVVLLAALMMLTVMVPSAHRCSALGLGCQIGGDHVLHPPLGASMGPQALVGPDSIQLQTQLRGDPAGEQHLAVATGAAALGSHGATQQTDSTVYM
jgi:hypothetical protein